MCKICDTSHILETLKPRNGDEPSKEQTAGQFTVNSLINKLVRSYATR